MTKYPALGRDDIDLAVPQRDNFDPQRAADPHVRLNVVAPDNTMLVDSPTTLASLSLPQRQQLFRDRDPLQRYRDGTLWWLGRHGDTEIIGMVLDDTEAATIAPTAHQLNPSEISPWPNWWSIRQAAYLDGQAAAVASHALALATWWKTSRHCSRCGNQMRVENAGWAQCCDHCNFTDYPRQDPAIIVAVIDSDDRLLLAHNTLWKPGSVSVIAGYIEAGEAPEQAVRREVKEETGLQVNDISYLTAQAWPFPRSLMIGYRSRVSDTNIQLVDFELDYADFYTRQRFRHECLSGKITPPSGAAIASTLIENWLGHPIKRIRAHNAW